MLCGRSVHQGWTDTYSLRFSVLRAPITPSPRSHLPSQRSRLYRYQWLQNLQPQYQRRCLWYIPARRRYQRERRSLALAMANGAKSTMIISGLSRSLKPPTPSSCNFDSCSTTLCTRYSCLQQHSSSGTYLSIATR